MNVTTTTRWVGIVAAIACAALYVGIGMGVLSVGSSTQEATTDLLGFGALMGAIYVITALALWRLRSRIWLAAVAAFQLIPLLGYVAFAWMREPPYELWGVLIKVCQAVVLVVAGTLAWRMGASPAETRRPSARGQAA